ncbi:protein FAR1-RELATED SEQUENCE 5-like [Cynara cardunculus var. scolymus]|uniref:protein FAR1-RELATED SEQUENCE 5-like n=1 Tax=Cynara cardunculus var. scolymus TaxID=59895 RepID=UPI000D62BD68|nr:protein FAR1-RELATED SEQUENCE 5-like [Cynara cardunculus var. scolymus]
MGESPGGTKLWIPKVDGNICPTVGEFFSSVDSIENMYRKYADVVGFDIRLASKKMNSLGGVQTRYFVCSKEGIPPKKEFDSLEVSSGERRRCNTNFKCTGCKACLKVHYVKESDRYEVYHFIEARNHMLCRSDEKLFTRSRHQLDYKDRKNVYHASSSKVGITQSCRMQLAINGGLVSSGGTARDHMNFRRDIMLFVGNKDAQMLINKMNKRREHCPHAMIFVPFVAIDNHKKSIVVGASLIRNESIVNFTWVLKAFMKAHGSQPQFVITDQCVVMKQAIPIVFPEATHRLCMWHITKKVKEKIYDHLAHGTSFKSKFNKLIWNVHISAEIFEEKWNALMDEFGLRGHSWFEKIQRKEHCSLEVATRTTIPTLLSPSKIEAQAAKVYTKTMFFEVQKEMNKAVWFCRVVEVVEVGDKMIYNITDKNKNSEVVHDVRGDSFDCNCNHFVRNGILCRHAFKVMLNSEVQSIPEKYILPRWRRELVPVELLLARVRYGEMDVEKQALINQATSMFDLIIGHVRNDKGALTEFVERLERLGDEISLDIPILTGTKQKRNDIQELLCVSEPESVDVLPPTWIHNKGCGTRKRLVGMSERISMNARSRKDCAELVIKWGGMIPATVRRRAIVPNNGLGVRIIIV